MNNIARRIIQMGAAYLFAIFTTSILADSLLDRPDEELIPLLKARISPSGEMAKVFDQIENPNSNLSLEEKLWIIAENLMKEDGNPKYSTVSIQTIINMGLRKGSTDYSLDKLRQILDDQFEHIRDLFEQESAPLSSTGLEIRQEITEQNQQKKQFYEFFVDAAFNVLALRGDEGDLARIRKFNDINSTIIRGSVSMIEEYIIERDTDPSLNRGFPGIKIGKEEAFQPEIPTKENNTTNSSISTAASRDNMLEDAAPSESKKSKSLDSDSNLIAPASERAIKWPVVFSCIAVLLAIFAFLTRAFIRK